MIYYRHEATIVYSDEMWYWVPAGYEDSMSLQRIQQRQWFLRIVRHNLFVTYSYQTCAALIA